MLHAARDRRQRGNFSAAGAAPAQPNHAAILDPAPLAARDRAAPVAHAKVQNINIKKKRCLERTTMALQTTTLTTRILRISQCQRQTIRCRVLGHARQKLELGVRAPAAAYACTSEKAARDLNGHLRRVPSGKKCTRRPVDPPRPPVDPPRPPADPPRPPGNAPHRLRSCARRRGKIVIVLDLEYKDPSRVMFPQF